MFNFNTALRTTRVYNFNYVQNILMRLRGEMYRGCGLQISLQGRKQFSANPFHETRLIGRTDRSIAAIIFNSNDFFHSRIIAI